MFVIGTIVFREVCHTITHGPWLTVRIACINGIYLSIFYSYFNILRNSYNNCRTFTTKHKRPHATNESNLKIFFF